MTSYFSTIVFDGKFPSFSIFDISFATYKPTYYKIKVLFELSVEIVDYFLPRVRQKFSVEIDQQLKLTS